MRRRGFTLVELLVASGAATLIIVLLYSSMVFYSRAYTREDEVLERGRRAQEVLGLFRDDFERAEGEVQPESLPDKAVDAVGFQGAAVAFLSAPRSGVNIINAFTNLKAQKPYLSKAYRYRDVWAPVGTQNGFTVMGRVMPACKYVGDQPPTQIFKAIPPWASTVAAVHVPVPFDRPTHHYFAIRKVVAGVVQPVIWAFHSEKIGKFPAGALVRWTERSGAKVVGGEQLTDVLFELQTDWPFADPQPPKRPGPWALPTKNQTELRLTFGRSKVTGPDPGFDAGAIFLLGP